MLNQLRNQIFSIANDASFEACALSVFQYQYKHCEVYQNFVNNLNVNPNKVKSSNEIPFLPISFLKHTLLFPGTQRPK